MTQRLFVSVDLPDRLADAVADTQDAFRDAEGLSFTDPKQAHVTLQFLGDVAEDRVERVVEAVEDATSEAGVEPFTAEIGGLGVFPSLDYVQVVWAGVREGSAELGRLHEAVERETTALGFDPDDHEFTPHVTLARMHDARGKDLVTRLVERRDPTVGSFEVREIRLTESHPGDDGPRYETVAVAEL
ncbi:MAG: RNA 2',3'-cyclic phosphodiesterase [Halobaculum sp.]